MTKNKNVEEKEGDITFTIMEKIDNGYLVSYKTKFMDKNRKCFVKNPLDLSRKFIYLFAEVEKHEQKAIK